MKLSLLRRIGQALARNGLWYFAYAAILLLLASLITYIVQERQRETLRRESTMAQDLLWQEQELRVRLQSNQNVLENLAHGIAAQAIRVDDFRSRADALMKSNPEILAVEWVNAKEVRMGGLPIYSSRPDALVPLDDQRLVEVIDGAATLGYPMYTNAIERFEPVMVLVVPFFSGTVYQGSVLATYALGDLLQQRVPWWMVQRYELQLVDSQGNVLAPNRRQPRMTGEGVSSVSFGDAGQSYRLLARSLQAPDPRNVQGLIVLVATLLVLLGFMLYLLRLRMQKHAAAEQALRDEVLFRNALEESLVTGLRAMDREGRLIYVNPAFCRMVGWAPEELVGHAPPLPFWPPELQAECAASYARILSGDCPRDGFTLRFIRRHGERFDVRLYASRLIDSQGQHRGWVASIYDITEINKERRALAESRQQLLTVLEGLEAAVCVRDLQNNTMLYRNRHHAATFRLPDELGVLCLLRWAGVQPGEDCKFTATEPLNGRVYEIEQRKIVWVDHREAMLEISSDITKRIEAEAEARARNEALQHTARLVNMGELASSLAHELNQPLAAIASYSAACDSMLGRETPPIDKVRATLVKMNEQAQRAGQIIRGIRQFVVKRGNTLQDCRFADLLRIPLELLEPVAHKAHARIRQDFPNDLPAFPGDAVMLEQVIFNLIKNGIEAMSQTPRNERVIGISANVYDNILLVVISDRGCGVSNPDKLFQSFYTTKADGMGIGLNICRSIIEQHRGYLWAEANPGGGTRMCFRLPLTDNEEEQ